MRGLVTAFENKNKKRNANQKMLLRGGLNGIIDKQSCCVLRSLNIYCEILTLIGSKEA